MITNFASIYVISFWVNNLKKHSWIMHNRNINRNLNDTTRYVSQYLQQKSVYKQNPTNALLALKYRTLEYVSYSLHAVHCTPYNVRRTAYIVYRTLYGV